MHRVAQLAIGQNNGRLVVTGVAAEEGGPAYNDTLAALRAAAVVKQLEARGVNKAVLEARSAGRDFPMSSPLKPDGGLLDGSSELTFVVY